MEIKLQEEEDGVGAAKRMKFGVERPTRSIDVVNLQEQFGPGLLDLSDDVLLIIFALLSPKDLISLSQSCSRLWNVTRDRTLWSYVDCRESALDADVFGETYLDYLLPGTKFLAVDFRLKTQRKKGLRPRPVSTQGALTFHLLRQITSVCIRLDTLILQDVSFDAQQIPFGQFPSTLTHLSLKNSDVRNLPIRVSYFIDIQRIMPNLQVLILSHSLWLESHSLMAISKCTKLRELRLQGCYALGDCIAYFSIATRFGFKDLQTLDLRGTQVGDPEVSCLNLVPSLRHLYLESITQYARRRDAEYYMNRVRQYPDITIVPHPDAGPVQNPVILLQRIDGEMVARNVTGEFHGLTPRPTPLAPREAAHSRCVRALVERWEAQQPSTSRANPSAFMQRLRERWQITDRRSGSPLRSRPVVVMPMKRTRHASNSPSNGPSNSDSSNGSSPPERPPAAEDPLRLHPFIRIIPEMCTSYVSDRPAVIGAMSYVNMTGGGTAAGRSSSNENQGCDEENNTSERKNHTAEGNDEIRLGQSQGTDGESSHANVEANGTNGDLLPDDDSKSDTDAKNLPREVKVEEGRVVVHISNNTNAAGTNGTNTSQGSSDEAKSFNHCDASQSSALRDEPNSSLGVSSDTNDSDCGRDGGDEADGSNPDLRRFKKPFLRNADLKASAKNESDEDSDVGADNPLPNYRDYVSNYMMMDRPRTRFNEWREESGSANHFLETKEGGDESRDKCPVQPRGNASTERESVGNFPIDNGPCCSYVPTVRNVTRTTASGCGPSMPSCSRYDPEQLTGGIPSTDGPSCSKSDTRKRKRGAANLQPRDEGDYSSGDDESDSGESEEGFPPLIPHNSNSLHFCTIGRARFSGMTVPFLHRVPQVTDSCVHAVCSGKASHVRPPHCIMTLRLATGPRGAEHPAHECRLETLVLRHFPKVTDQSLYALSKLVSLRVLDVTGTSVTACGVKNFRLMRPDVQVTSDHDNPPEP